MGRIDRDAAQPVPARHAARLLDEAQQVIIEGLHGLAQPGHQTRHPRGQRQLALARECPRELGMTRALQEVIRVQILGKRSAET